MLISAACEWRMALIFCLKHKQVVSRVQQGRRLVDCCTHQEINLLRYTNWDQQPWRLVRAFEVLVLFLQLLSVTRCSARLFIVMSLTVLSFDLNNLLNYSLKQGQKSSELRDLCLVITEGVSQ